MNHMPGFHFKSYFFTGLIPDTCDKKSLRIVINIFGEIMSTAVKKKGPKEIKVRKRKWYGHTEYVVCCGSQILARRWTLELAEAIAESYRKTLTWGAEKATAINH